MSHNGIAGFGTAATYAAALGLNDDQKKLKVVTKDIYGADEFMTQLAESSDNTEAEAEALPDRGEPRCPNRRLFRAALVDPATDRPPGLR